jgi:hypothetical protein
MVQPTLLMDAKFSREVDLAPGATSADVSAAMRVCLHNILETLSRVDPQQLPRPCGVHPAHLLKRHLFSSGCLGLSVLECLYCFSLIQYSIDLEYCFAFLFCIYVRVLDLISSLYDLILTRPYLAPTTR